MISCNLQRAYIDAISYN